MQKNWSVSEIKAINFFQALHNSVSKFKNLEDTMRNITNVVSFYDAKNGTAISDLADAEHARTQIEKAKDALVNLENSLNLIFPIQE